MSPEAATTTGENLEASAMKKLLRITGPKIATLDATADVLEDTDLWIADGRFAALLPSGSPSPMEGSVETLVVQNALALPGLVNAHSHSYASLLRGTVAGAPLDLFVMEAMARRAPRSDRQVKVAVLRHAVEMLKNGITGVVDHFRYGTVPTFEAISAAFTAYAEAGMRAAIAPMFEDRIYLDSMPVDEARLPQSVREKWRAMPIPSPDDYFALMEDVLLEWRGHERFQVLLGIDGPQRCTPRLLEMAGEFATRHGIGLHTHLLETKTQALMAPADYGGSFVAYLDRFGLIGPKSSLAHFVWCNERDIELAAERGVNVVQNVVSNLILGSGIQPTGRLIEAGVNVALGCDSGSCGPASIFEQAKFSMLLSRISQPDCERWISAPQAMRMATTNGGAVLGQPGNLGVIRVGAHADLTIVNLAKPTYRPLGDIWNHLVMYEAGASVDTVIVAGEIVVRRGRCTRLNEDDLVAEADEFAAYDNAANAEFLATARAERAVFQPLILEALERSTPVDRFAHLI
jgi:cytosine/adenosine deaminase-related metal-dependent hydrolase